MDLSESPYTALRKKTNAALLRPLYLLARKKLQMSVNLCVAFLLWRKKGEPLGSGISTLGLFTLPPILTAQLGA